MFRVIIVCRYLLINVFQISVMFFFVQFKSLGVHRLFTALFVRERRRHKLVLLRWSCSLTVTFLFRSSLFFFVCRQQLSAKPRLSCFVYDSNPVSVVGTIFCIHVLYCSRHFRDCQIAV